MHCPRNVSTSSDYMALYKSFSIVNIMCRFLLGPEKTRL